MNEVTKTLDIEIATLDQLEEVSLTDLLGGDVSNFSTTNNLPDGVYGFAIEKQDLKRLAADMESGKKASISLNLQLSVMHVFSCDDRDIEPSSLVGKKHFERFPLLLDFGKENIVKLILGIVGVSFTDKRAWADIGGSFAEVLEQLVDNKVQFGATIKNTSRGGYDNCDIVYKAGKFINMEAYQEQV